MFFIYYFLDYKLNKTVYSTPFELMKLYNEEG